MQYLNNMSIKNRLFISFFLIFLVFIIFSLISIRYIQYVGKLTKDLYDHPLQVSNAALNANLGVIRMHRSMKDVILSQNEIELDNVIDDVNLQEQLVFEEFTVIREQILGEKGEDLLRETVDLFIDWKKTRDEVISLVVEGERESASLITKGKGAYHVVLLERKIESLTDYARNKAGGFLEDAVNLQNGIVRNLIILIFTVALLLLLLGYFLINGILSNIFLLSTTMTKITTTGELVKADLGGKNELTDMSRDFNNLIDRLEVMFWLKSGQNLLNNEISGELQFNEITAKSINFVSRYTAACTGAIYSYNQDLSLCKLESSFAFVESLHYPYEFKPGEGIPGQVALEMKPILLKNITRGEALGQSGTTSEPPKSIYAVPLVIEEKLIGVLEIASFEELDEIKMEFLDTAASIISISLFTASQRGKIKELLKLSQESNEQLQSQSEELQAMNEEFQHQAEELNLQNIELEVQGRQLEDANRLKSEFLSNMSHELRTPLNSVMALSRVLIMQAKEKLSIDENNYLSIIERNGKHLLNLINDILDLSKIEAGRMNISIKLFSIKSTIGDIFESLKLLAEVKGIKIIVDIPEDLPLIESDELRVHQVLQNIMSNAVKFTTSGKVDISVSWNEKNVFIAIKDSGIGISDKNLPHIFDEFRQIDGSSSRMFEGTGLGLAIANKSIKLLHGKITAESIYGEGTTFNVVLPVKWDVKTELYKQEIEGPPEKLIQNGQQTVLIIDDDPGAVALISKDLVKAGYNTITANSGEKALDLAASYLPSVIILDIVMPKMDGWETLQALKKDPHTADIPVIIGSILDDRETGFALGASGYITKPFTSVVLIDEINKILVSNAKGNKSSKVRKSSKNARILLVEDNESAVIQVKSILENAGFIVDVAIDGEEALIYINKTIPDGIILDLMMPGVDGYEVLKKLRENPDTSDVPVTILTAKDLAKEDFNNLSSGNIQTYIQKGDIDREDLLLQTNKMIGLVPEKKEFPMVKKKLKTTGEKRNIPIILVIEDNPDNMTTIKAILKTKYEIIEAIDGKTGMEAILTEEPDLILLDMTLPVMDGFQLVRKIKSDKRVSKIPVIALTALAMKGDKEGILKAGCDDYISKPIEFEVLLNKVSSWIK